MRFNKTMKKLKTILVQTQGSINLNDGKAQAAKLALKYCGQLGNEDKHIVANMALKVLSLDPSNFQEFLSAKAAVPQS